ncbi:hypothetical protein HY478_03685 [Candidatus Uhrbacteria bacterium]|nr:hypothetical protein [Candidatus Uhrbacteria bacterium]
MNLRAFSHRYLANHIPRELRELYAAHTIAVLAGALISVFEPIYLYVLGFSIAGIFWWYAGIYVGYFLLLPLAARIVVRIGFEHAMLLSTPFLIAYYGVLSMLDRYPQTLVLAGVFLLANKLLLWPAFHGTLARHGVHGERGREITVFVLINRVIGVAAPAIGGIVLARIGPPVLFAVVAVLIMLSNVPLLLTREEKTYEVVSYRGVWATFRHARLRRPLLAFVGFGEEQLWYVGWAIFMFLALGGYEPVGYMLSGSLVVGSVVALIIGRVIDERMLKRGSMGVSPLVRLGGSIVALVWVFRSLLPRGVAIVLVEALDRIAFPVVGMSLRAMNYEMAKIQKTVTINTAFEMALAFGKTIACVLGAILATFTVEPWRWFAVSGFFFVMCYLMLGPRRESPPPFPAPPRIP